VRVESNLERFGFVGGVYKLTNERLQIIFQINRNKLKEMQVRYIRIRIYERCKKQKENITRLSPFPPPPDWLSKL
jgi:arabinogalactan endo-1,4-beta-galactosidase